MVHEVAGPSARRVHLPFRAKEFHRPVLDFDCVSGGFHSSDRNEVVRHSRGVDDPLEFDDALVSIVFEREFDSAAP